MRLLTIDPGLAGTGYAIFTDTPRPVFSGVVRPAKSAALLTPQSLGLLVWKTKSIVEQLLDVPGLYDYNPGLVSIEWPAFWGSSAVSYASTAGGKMFKLVFLIGAIAEAFIARDIRVSLLPVNKWKGQLPKEVVKKRISRIIRRVEFRDHEADAVGMGLYLQGRL